MLGYVYMLCNRYHNVLYTGSTSDLKSRIYQHRLGAIPGFTKKYNVQKLVYFEKLDDVETAISREKTIKGWSRSKKERLILLKNPTWSDLYGELT